MKKAAPTLFFLCFFLGGAYAQISDTLTLGETKTYLTPSQNFTVSFFAYDLRTEKAIIMFDEMLIALVPLQVSPDKRFHLVDIRGQSAKEVTAEFTIETDSAFDCTMECVNNSVTRLLSSVGATLCKAKCKQGCDAYRQVACTGDEIWVQDSCGEPLEKIGEKCQQGKRHALECLSDSECKNQNCYYGKCIPEAYKEGDNICSLPNEPCNSSDCTCTGYPPVSDDRYPILLLHGFASSPGKLRLLQSWLASDLGYENGGEIDLTDTCESQLTQTVYRGSFYDSGKSEARLPLLVNKAYSKVPGYESNQMSYTTILASMIAKIKRCTGSEKVNIIGHSLGGIVGFSYLLDADNAKNVQKIILIATPHKGGIYGNQEYTLFQGLATRMGDRTNLLEQCAGIGLPSIALTLIDGRDYTADCEQLQKSSLLDERITQLDETPGLVEYYTVVGDIDGKGDGMVPLESAQLEGAIRNDIITCNHFDLKHPAHCEDAYKVILGDLGYNLSGYKAHTVKNYVSSLIDSIKESLPFS